MARAFGGAFSMALTMLVLNIASPEVAEMLTQLILGVLKIAVGALSVVASQSPDQLLTTGL